MRTEEIHPHSTRRSMITVTTAAYIATEQVDGRCKPEVRAT